MKQLIILLSAAFAACTVQAKDYNIRDYGATNDTTRLSTQAIQQAIDACSQAGGGRVVVPTGSYKTGLC